MTSKHPIDALEITATALHASLIHDGSSWDGGAKGMAENLERGLAAYYERSLPVAQSVLAVYTRELERLQALARHGDRSAATDIIRTLAYQNLALRALGYRLNWDDGDDDNLYLISEDRK